MYRQGDVLIEKVAEIPAGAAVAPKAGRYVLAEGEATGHAHTVDARYGELVESRGMLYLRLTAAAPLEHQEHATITLEPGTYRVTRQREWTDADEPRQVAD